MCNGKGCNYWPHFYQTSSPSGLELGNMNFFLSFFGGDLYSNKKLCGCKVLINSAVQFTSCYLCFCSSPAHCTGEELA